MILVYALVVLVVGGAKLLTHLKASRFQRKYEKEQSLLVVARENLDNTRKQGNSNKVIRDEHERANARVVRLNGTCEFLQEMWELWQGRTDSVGKLLTTFIRWKSKYVSYGMGWIDAVIVIAGLAYIGVLPEVTTAVISMVEYLK